MEAFDAPAASRVPLRAWWRSGEPWIWLNAAAITLCLLAVCYVLALIAWRGFAHFWPAPVVELKLKTATGHRRVLGEIVQKETLSVQQFSEASGEAEEGLPATIERWLLKRGNRRVAPPEFEWINAHEVISKRWPEDVVVVERLEWGNAYGYLRSLPSDKPHDRLRLELESGKTLELFLADVVRYWQPNRFSFKEKLLHYFSSLLRFLSAEPREANTEGGVFPAIFGTVLMVLLMALLVTPFGIVAAVYLHEYARQGPFVQLIRIAVNNLAGVPSIVYGVFGLGFFVYFLGGNIDRLFFPETLPAPTFGTPGLLWASLTLALLTVPVVIVSTEEGLARIPRRVREGSLALGATKAETLFHIILPSASPAILTGIILAVARAAGEVAPLMLVGVVKLAPKLPLDSTFPFLHLERKFMHLGFHIYDVGFQSPNVEAARPLVFATALLLVLIVLSLNLFALVLRSRLEVRYRDDDD